MHDGSGQTRWSHEPELVIVSPGRKGTSAKESAMRLCAISVAPAASLNAAVNP